MDKKSYQPKNARDIFVALEEGLSTSRDIEMSSIRNGKKATAVSTCTTTHETTSLYHQEDEDIHDAIADTASVTNNPVTAKQSCPNHWEYGGRDDGAFVTDGLLDELLKPLLIDCDEIGELLGEGSCGKVFKVKVGEDTHYAGKIYRAISSQPRDKCAKKFSKELSILNKVRHENIVAFMGITFNQSRTPLLLMELMNCTLQSCLLELPCSLPLQHKVKLLLDVANGLNYLHNLPKPIIHRDLTANNVLLNHTRTVAKISDLGNARIVELDTSIPLTAQPGTLNYMPPEALGKMAIDSPSYDTKLDIFSFGHLTLIAIIEEGPETLELLSKNYTVRDRNKQRSERERRSKYIKKAYEALPQEHKLTKVMRICLSDASTDRPSAYVLVQLMEDMDHSLESIAEESVEENTLRPFLVQIIKTIASDFPTFSQRFVEFSLATPSAVDNIETILGIPASSKASRLYQCFLTQLSSSSTSSRKAFEKFLRIFSSEAAHMELARDILKKYVVRAPDYDGHLKTLIVDTPRDQTHCSAEDPPPTNTEDPIPSHRDDGIPCSMEDLLSNEVNTSTVDPTQSNRTLQLSPCQRSVVMMIGFGGLIYLLISLLYGISALVGGTEGVVHSNPVQIDNDTYRCVPEKINLDKELIAVGVIILVFIPILVITIICCVTVYFFRQYDFTCINVIVIILVCSVVLLVCIFITIFGLGISVAVSLNRIAKYDIICSFNVVGSMVYWLYFWIGIGWLTLAGTIVVTIATCSSSNSSN